MALERILCLIASIPLLLAGCAYSKEWCEAAPQDGKPRYGVCLPGGAGARYMVEVVPVVSQGIHLQNDVSIVVAGSDGRETKPIPIASSAVGTERRLFAERADVGDPVRLRAALAGTKPWKCQRITVWKDYKYWVFDCTGILDSKSPQATYELSGNKLYEASVQTGNDEQAGTHGGIELALAGNGRQASPKLLKQGFYAGTQQKIRFRAADVGDIEEIILTNTADDDPWYCDFLRIKAEDGKIYPFTVKRWIGFPYDKSVTIMLKPSKDMDLPPQDIECHTRAADLFSRIPEGLEVFKVRCPMNCQASEFAHVAGSSIHPASSSICVAAILDGVSSASGGEVVVSVVGAIPEYSGMASSTGVESDDYAPSADKPVFSFFVYQSDSIDAIGKDVRVVDAYGKLSSYGRLEIRRNGAWGSVCKKGLLAEFSPDSARKSCQELGYLHGILITTGCSLVHGQNVCAGKGYPVAAAGVMCRGPERTIGDCTFEEPTEFCQDHTNDIAVQCTNNPPDRQPEPGTLRIVDATGAPSRDGIGRLEYYVDGFGTVCSDEWSKESETVACDEMGYSGVKEGGISHTTCNDVAGANYCGRDEQKISLVNVSCQGDEPSLRRCPHVTSNDIYCVHSEDVVVACEGNGDPSGIGMFKKEELPNVAQREFAPKLQLNCGDRPVSKAEMKGLPGAMFVVTCPEGCSEEPGALRGTFIYTDDSPICKAAVHAGAIGDTGGDVVVVLGHKQKSLFGSERHEITSESFGVYERTFMVSHAVSTVRARTARESKKGQKTKYAGTSALSAQSKSVFPTFLQLDNTESGEATPEMVYPDKFHWFAPEDWNGFRGEKGDYIDTSNMPGGNLISSFRDFTIMATARVTGGQGTWRAILAHSDCDGFQLSIDNQDELVFEQACHPSFISTGFKPQMGTWFDVAVTYFQPQRAIAVFVNEQRVVFQKTDIDFNLKTHMTIGRSSETDSEYFVGQITAVHAFNYVLSPQQIKQVHQAKSPVTAGETNVAGPRGQRKTEDGRVCLGPCTSEEPAFSLFPSGSHPTNPAIELTCQDNLQRPEFNGHTGQKFRIRCPEECGHDEKGVVVGSKVYSPDSSICKAAIHAGTLRREGGEAVVTLHNGLTGYSGSRGYGGVHSISENEPQWRSFSIVAAPRIAKLSCSDNGGFLITFGEKERAIVLCPPGCTKVADAEVYGSEIYSPISSVCRAAIHAGKLDDDGGEVEIEVGPRRESFTGSEMHRIVSGSSGSYLKSFSVISSLAKNKSAPAGEL